MPTPLKLDMSDAIRLERVDAFGLGLAVRLARPLACTGSQPLGLGAANRVAPALRDWIDRRCTRARVVEPRDAVPLVGMCDTWAGPADAFERTCAERLANVALLAAMQAVRTRPPGRGRPVALLANASFTEAADPDAAMGRAKPVETTDDLVLPFVVVVDRSVALSVIESLEGAEVVSGDPLFAALDAMCAAAGGITRATVFGPMGEDGEGDGDPGDADDDRFMDGLPDEDLTFVLIAEEQGRRLESAHGARALHDLEALPQHIRRLQSLSERENEAQFAYSQSVVVAVTGETVYLGFKTLDDLGKRALLEHEASELSAEALASRWCGWYLDDYQAVVRVLEAAHLRLAVFPQMEWERRFLDYPRRNRPARDGVADLPTLDEVYAEESDHEIDPAATGELVLSRVCICGDAEEAPDEAAADGSRRIVCAAVRVLDRTGRGVSQSNLYATRPAGIARLGEYIEQFMKFPRLPMNATVDALLLCDEHLQLMVPLPTGPIRVVEEDDADEEALPDLLAMREPPDGGGHGRLN